MTEKAKEARRAYQREWARKNPDKVKAQQERYWTRKAEQAEAKIKAEQEQAERSAVIYFNGGDSKE